MNRSSFRHRILPSLLMILLGLMLLGRPGLMIRSSAKLLGGALMAIGILRFVLREDLVRYGFSISLVMAVSCFLAGLLIFTRYRALTSILPTAAGFLIMISGAMDLSRSYARGQLGDRRWPLTALLSIVSIVFGLYIFLHPFSAVTMAARMIGAMFIYNAAVDLLIRIR